MKAIKICAVVIGLIWITSPHPALAFKRIFLTSGASWTVVSDWSDVNVIEAIGAGGGGGDETNDGAGGGGGGAYAVITNLTGLTIGNSITYQIGPATSAVNSNNSGNKGADTFFNGSGTTCADSSPSVCAQGGAGGTVNSPYAGGAGGLASAGIPASCSGCFSGGTGGAGSSTDGSGGGGGAAGPYGAGGNGGDAGTTAGGGGGGADGGTDGTDAVTTTAGPGGNNFNGQGGGAASVNGSAGGGGGGGGDGCLAGPGGAGNIEWTATEFGPLAGPGGGGGGAGNGIIVDPGCGTSSNGGLYGGGGGGSEATNEGLGATGIIVITYIPSVPASPRVVRLRGGVVLRGGTRLQ